MVCGPNPFRLHLFVKMFPYSNLKKKTSFTNNVGPMYRVVWSVNDRLSGNVQKPAGNLPCWFVLLKTYWKPARNLRVGFRRFPDNATLTDLVLDGPHGRFPFQFFLEIFLYIKTCNFEPSCYGLKNVLLRRGHN